MNCLVCEYRQTFNDGHLYPVHEASYLGISLSFEAEIGVCKEHVDWVLDEFPKSLRKIGDTEMCLSSSKIEDDEYWFLLNAYHNQALQNIDRAKNCDRHDKEQIESSQRLAASYFESALTAFSITKDRECIKDDLLKGLKLLSHEEMPF